MKVQPRLVVGWTPEGWQRLAGGRAQRHHRGPRQRGPRPTPEGSQHAAGRRCDPAGVGGRFVARPGAGGVAALDHRLIAATPPGSKPNATASLPEEPAAFDL